MMRIACTRMWRIQRSHAVALLVVAVFTGVASAVPVKWEDALTQPEAWYGGAEAKAVAESVLLHQRSNGGWNKRIDYTKTLSDSEAAAVAKEKDSTETTIDNSATTRELTFLARLFQATDDARFRDAFNRGLAWLLNAQYPNGGWPQYHPLRGGYHDHVTFNDDAMVNVLRLLRDVSDAKPPYAFVEPAHAAAAKAAFDRGIECILNAQVVVDGRRTAWCAQHDTATLQPAKARIYEHPSLSGMETVPIVRLLMSIDPPDPRVIEAVQAAVKWLDDVKLMGVDVKDVAEPERDRVVVEDANADPMWARFYEIGTNRPIFSGRDGTIRYSLAEVERERRAGYRWYTRRPLDLLRDDYPAWQAQWSPTAGVPAAK